MQEDLVKLRVARDGADLVRVGEQVIASLTRRCCSPGDVGRGSSNHPVSSFLWTTIVPVPSHVRTFML
jgi:hypothetical protein